MTIKTRFALAALAAALLMAPAAYADTVSATAAAAIEGSFGLEVVHDNSSAAYVEDQTPNGETVYRGSFLFDANNVNASATSNFRQLIMTTKGPNPNPGVGNCTMLTFIDPIRIWYFPVGGVGQNSTVQIFAFGNQCGPRGSSRIPIPNSGAVKVCWEWQTGNANTGLVALAVVNTGDPCPTSGDPAWSSSNITNGLTSVDRVRLGTPATNNFGAGEGGSFYFDQFESFRTLTP